MEIINNQVPDSNYLISIVGDENSGKHYLLKQMLIKFGNITNNNFFIIEDKLYNILPICTTLEPERIENIRFYSNIVILIISTSDVTLVNLLILVEIVLQSQCRNLVIVLNRLENQNFDLIKEMINSLNLNYILDVDLHIDLMIMTEIEEDIFYDDLKKFLIKSALNIEHHRTELSKQKKLFFINDTYFSEPYQVISGKLVQGLLNKDDILICGKNEIKISFITNYSVNSIGNINEKSNSETITKELYHAMPIDFVTLKCNQCEFRSSNNSFN